MSEWLLFPLLLLGGWLPGRLLLPHLIAEQIPGGEALHPLERHFAALSLGLLFIGWLAFLLAELGAFSLVTIGAGWLLLVLGLLVLTRRRPRRISTTPPDDHATVQEPDPAMFAGIRLPARLEYLLLLLWLPAAIWLFFRPHEAILGGSDAGVYVNTAAHVAQTGHLLIDEPALAELDPALYPSLLRERREGEGTPYYLYPGFNVVLEPRGRVLPDFFHLHPVWQAVGHAAGGVRAALLLPALWALLGAFAVYLTARQLAGWPVAIVSIVGLSTTALQVWFARYPVTEMLTQYLLWLALWALGAWLVGRRPLRLWGLLGGLALGQLFLTRIDTFFLLVIPLLAGLWLTRRRRWQPAHLWFFAPLAVLTAHSLIHSYAFSRPYFERIAFHVAGMARRNWMLPAVALVMGLALFLVLRNRRLGVVARRHGRPLLAFGALAIFLLAAYAWFVRPVVGATASYQEWYDGQTIVLTDRENLIRLGWYLSPLGVWLGAAGASLLLWRLNRKSAVLVGVGLFFSLLYLWRIQATPHQIYAMRRYVPAVLPFFVISAAYLFGWLAQRRAWYARLVGLLLLPLWLAGFVWSAQGFITHVDNQGLMAQVEALDARLDDGAILIFNDQTPVSMGDLLGTPLNYQYGHDAFTLRQPEAITQEPLQAQITQWQRAGRPIYWVGDPAPLAAGQISDGQETVEITFTFLENAYEHKPSRLIPARWVLPLSRLQ